MIGMHIGGQAGRVLRYAGVVVFGVAVFGMALGAPVAGPLGPVAARAATSPQAVPSARGVPLPRPRPAQAPPRDPGADPAVSPDTDRNATEQPAPPPPTACRQALTDAIAIAPSLPAISGPGACGGEDLVRLEAVVLGDASRVPLKPPAVLRCAMATALAQWVRGDLAALARAKGTSLAEIDNFDSYSCRSRNRVFGAQLSEHGRANAIDIRGVRLGNGQMLGFTDRRVSRENREALRGAVCARFMTVLGPGSDWFHEDHVHLDLAERRTGMNLCRWEVWDPLPEIAPLMPAARPPEAPPRPSRDEEGAPRGSGDAEGARD
jgi:hypothetical protein